MFCKPKFHTDDITVTANCNMETPEVVESHTNSTPGDKNYNNNNNNNNNNNYYYYYWMQEVTTGIRERGGGIGDLYGSTEKGR